MQLSIAKRVISVSINKININDYYSKMLVGKDLSIPEVKSWRLIKDRNLARQDNVALSEDDKNITYGEMFESWDSMAKAFSALGMSRSNNSRVLVLMPNVAETASIDYALDMTGAVCDFIDPTTGSEKIERYVAEENITDIISLDLLYAQNLKSINDKLKNDLGVKNIVLTHSAFMLSQMPRKIQTLGGIVHFANKFDRRVLRLEDVLRNSRYQQIDYDQAGVDELSLITHTSGTTTGIGKPIPISDYNRNALIKNYELANFGYEPGMTMMHFIPYFAGYGANNTVGLGLSQGLNLQQIPLFSPAQFGYYLDKLKSNIILANTPCWLNLCNNPQYQNIDLSYLTYASSGGTPTSKEDEEKINDFLISHGSKVLLTKGYGLSELCGCCIVTIDGYNSIGSVGVKLPLNDVILRDNSTGLILPETGYVRGEALVHSESMTSGYLDGNQIVQTINIDGKEYLATKDVLERNEFGEYSYVERIDRMFQRYDAYNVYPLQVENLFKALDEVEECVVVPSYDEEKSGNVPKAYVKLHPGKFIQAPEEFLYSFINNAFLKNKMSDVYNANFRDIPHEIVFVDEIPTNTMLKPDYHRILDEGLVGDTYNVLVQEDNMNVYGINVVCANKNKQKTLK